MLIPVVDADGARRVVAMQAQDTLTDGSGALANAALFQEVFAANADRAGFLFQNTSPNLMVLNEITGDDAALTDSWAIGPGRFFPPAGYPIPVGKIMVAGGGGSAVGDTFVAREW